MKTTLLALCLALATSPASAQRHKSQHPRVGQLAELTFKRASSDLAIGIEQKLTDVVTWAKENPDGLVVLDGHADARGSAVSNVRLSMRRADSVRGQLIVAGVEPDRIVIAAYGEDGPKRRRVVIWGTRAGMDAVVARTLEKGHAVLWSPLITEMDRRPQPGVVSRR